MIFDPYLRSCDYLFSGDREELDRILDENSLTAVLDGLADSCARRSVDSQRAEDRYFWHRASVAIEQAKREVR